MIRFQLEVRNVDFFISVCLFILFINMKKKRVDENKRKQEYSWLILFFWDEICILAISNAE